MNQIGAQEMRKIGEKIKKEIPPVAKKNKQGIKIEIMKLIDKHFQWMKVGRLPNTNGLCAPLSEEEYNISFSLLRPTAQQARKQPNYCWWGRESFSEGQIIDSREYEKYNSFRQTIVLFICAMHGEI